MRICLRGIVSRSAVICGVVFVVAELLVVFTRTSWIGFLGYTPEWANAGLYVATPLVAGASAFLSRSHFSREVVGITGTRALPGASRAVLSAWVRTFVLALAAHGLVMTIALAVTVCFGSTGALTWQPFVYALMPVAMACAIGTAIAATFPFAWSAALAIIVTYAVWFTCVTTGSAVPVNVGGATVSLAGLEYRTEGLLASLLVAAFVTTSVLAVAVESVRRQSFESGVSLLAVSTAVIVLAGAVLSPWIDSSRFASAGAADFVCEGAQPKVCVPEAYSARLGMIARSVDAAARPLRDVGVDLSGVVLRGEVAGGTPGVDGVLLMPFGQLNGIGTQERDYAHALLRPVNCRDYYAPQPTEELDRLLTAAQLIGDWLDAKIIDAKPSLSDSEVQTLYDGLLSCAVDERSFQSAPTR